MFSGGQTHAGAFAGDCYKGKTSITDCWAEGTVKTEDSGCFAGTKNHEDGNDLENTDVCKNTYTLAKIEGRKNAQTNKKVKNNNYITNEVGGFELGFAAASMAEMNAAFKALPNWTVADGKYPQIKGMAATKDAAAYTVQTGAQDATASGTASDTASGGTAQTGSESEVTKDNKGNAVVDANTIEDNSLMKMDTPELILIIVLSVFIVAVTAGSVVTMILILKKKKSE